NSEIWGDLNQLRCDFEQQGGSSSVLIRAANDAAMADLKKTIDDDQRLDSGAIGEKEDYAKQTESGAPLEALGFAVAIIMRVGSADMLNGLMLAAMIECIGGFLPAWSASKRNIVTTMRDL